MLLPSVRLFRLTPLRLVLCASRIFSNAYAACLEAHSPLQFLTVSCQEVEGKWCWQTYPPLMHRPIEVCLSQRSQPAENFSAFWWEVLQDLSGACAFSGRLVCQILALAVD